MKDVRKFLADQNGIGLVEVIFSLGIALVILTSLVSLAVFTLRTSVQNKLLIKASSIATQELELVRAYRDGTDWVTFRNSVRQAACSPAINCRIDPGLTVVTSPKTVGTGAEVVTVAFGSSDCTGYSGIPSDCVKISVRATWSVGGQTKYVHNYTELSNWEK